jgi:hypothetical protein
VVLVIPHSSEGSLLFELRLIRRGISFGYQERPDNLEGSVGKPRSGIGVFVRGNAILMLTLSMSSQLGAQEITVVPDDISCPNCRITTERLFDLGGPGGTTNIVHTNYLPMDSRGRVYFQSLYFPGTIHVFGEHGKHIHSFGREGEVLVSSDPGPRFSSALGIRCMRSAVGETRAARANLHDTIIEVLDPVQRRVLARIRLDEVAIPKGCFGE